MKKNRMMRLASVLLVLCLLTTSVISGTFAKYTTTATTDDTARVAKWGFTTASITFEDLFASSYDNVLAGDDTTAIIAPGTKGKTSFTFALSDAAKKPEVAYTFTVSTADSSNATSANTNIRWRLTQSDTAPADWSSNDTWDKLLTDIAALAGTDAVRGTKEYAANTIPDMVGKTYYIHWDWAYENSNDAADITLGNAAVGADQVITLKVTITATQKD